MIFSELYSAYYNAVAEILAKIVAGERDEKVLQNIVSEKAFLESGLSIMPALKSEKWQLVKGDLSTPLKHAPTMPLTTLQKRWLKAISLDPRIKLFNINFDGLEDVSPLFTPDDYCLFDKYGDGDDFLNEKYVSNFKTALYAIKNKKMLRVNFLNRKQERITLVCKPEKIEYSEKDDKFRLKIERRGSISFINFSKITSCKITDDSYRVRMPVIERECEQLLLKITDERNALERCMLHFAHFEKRAEKIARKEYLLYVNYDKEDRSELVMRVLSFGPLVEVLQPDAFREELIKKLKNQMALNL